MELLLIMDDKKRKILIVALLALLVLLIVAIVVCVIVINVKKDVEDNKIVPDYPPQETDPNQSPMDNDPGGTLEIEEGGGGDRKSTRLNSSHVT